MAEIDWFELWRQLSRASVPGRRGHHPPTYLTRARRQSEWRPDPLLDFVLDSLTEDSTFLDIGAGSGRWSIPAARQARLVTALEPSHDMLEILRENITREKLNNIQAIQDHWEEADIEPHDVVACAHAAYNSPDLAAFVIKMEQISRKGCYLSLRLPPHDGIIGELSRAIYGHPHDSPNAIIAHNALYSIGIYTNILVEGEENAQHWKDNSLEDALNRVRRHLRLESTTKHDELILNTLSRRLIHTEDNCYHWPDGMRSALLWWHPRRSPN